MFDLQLQKTGHGPASAPPKIDEPDCIEPTQIYPDSPSSLRGKVQKKETTNLPMHLLGNMQKRPRAHTDPPASKPAPNPLQGRALKRVNSPNQVIPKQKKQRTEPPLSSSGLAASHNHSTPRFSSPEELLVKGQENCENRTCACQPKPKQPHPDAFFDAIKRGELEEVRNHVSSGRSVNQPDGYNTTPLALAVRKGRLDVVRFLLSQQADISQATLFDYSEYYNILVYAAKHDQLEIVLAILGTSEDISLDTLLKAFKECLFSRSNPKIAEALWEKLSQHDPGQLARFDIINTAIDCEETDLVETLVDQYHFDINAHDSLARAYQVYRYEKSKKSYDILQFLMHHPTTELTSREAIRAAVKLGDSFLEEYLDLLTTPEQKAWLVPLMEDFNSVASALSRVLSEKDRWECYECEEAIAQSYNTFSDEDDDVEIVWRQT